MLNVEQAIVFYGGHVDGCEIKFASITIASLMLKGGKMMTIEHLAFNIKTSFKI